MSKQLLHKTPTAIKELLLPVVISRMNNNVNYNQDPINFANKFLDVYLNRYLFIIDYIFEHNHLFHRKSFDYCPVSNKKFAYTALFSNSKWKLGKKLFTVVKEDLINAGIIKVNEAFSKKNGISKTFKINTDTPTEKLKYYDIEGKRAIKAIQNIIDKQKAKELDLSNDLIKYNLYFMQKLDFSSLDINGLSNFEINQISKFTEQNFRINNTTTGRTYTTFTNLKKTIRKYVMIDNERIMGVDVKNSQPLFFGEFIKSKIKEEERTNETNQLLDFIKIGKFYEIIYLYTTDIISVNDIILVGEERDLMKKRVFSYLYNDAKYETDVEIIFENNFPQICKLLKKHKGPFLAKMMQLEEAKIINLAYRRIIERNIEAGTLFDSIYAKESDIGIVYEEMENAFKINDIDVVLTYSEDDFRPINPIQVALKEIKVIDNTNEAITSDLSVHKDLSTTDTKKEFEPLTIEENTTIKQHTTSEEKLINKIQQLKVFKENGGNIGCSGYADLAKYVDFDHLSEEFIKDQIQSITPSVVLVNSKINRFSIEKFHFFWLGEFIISGDINDQKYKEKIIRIGKELIKLGKLAA